MPQRLIGTAVLVLLAFALGCSTLSSSKQDPEGEAVLSANASQELDSPAYAFDDVEVPADMNLQSDESFIMQTPQVKAGALVYTGWVDPASLFSYYMRKMENAGWSPLSYFKYGHHLMVFQKPEKVCVIRIHKGHFTTRLEIWVSPSMPDQADGVSERVLPQ